MSPLTLYWTHPPLAGHAHFSLDTPTSYMACPLFLSYPSSTLPWSILCSSEYASDVHVLIACKAIQALGTMALRLPEHVQTCTIKLMSLMSLNIDYITAEIFVAFTSESLKVSVSELTFCTFLPTEILRTYEVMLDMVLSALPQSVDSVATPEGKAAFIWILGEYGEVSTVCVSCDIGSSLLLCCQLLSNSPYILEEVSKHISEEESSLVKLSLLTAMMKLFFKRPPECQEMLGRLLEYAIGQLY